MTIPIVGAPRSYGGAGAVWRVFARADLEGLRSWLWKNLSKFSLQGQPLTPDHIADPLHDQVCLGYLPS